jgi:ATP-binding cassette, subfamily F, member 3
VRKSEVDARLADPSIYDANNKDQLKTLILDQAYIAKELEQLETEWLEQQEALEKLATG